MLVAGLLLACVAVTALWYRRHSPGCLDGPSGMQICATSDLLKLPSHGRVPDEGPDFELASGVVLRAVRGETVAFQTVFVHRGDAVQTRLSVEGLEGLHVERFLALYHWADPAGYEWGTPSEVLPWPDWYPDALVPFERRCPTPQTLVESFPVPGAHGYNRAVWIDVFVPQGTPVGEYRGEIVVDAGGREVRAPLTVVVVDAALPETPTVDAVAELYDAYVQEGIGAELGAPGWSAMSQCYQQLAHAHRVTFIERFNGWVGPDPNEARTGTEWDAYDEAFGPVLTGKLFTPEAGYVGPGVGVAPPVWRTPWPQVYSGSAQPLPEGALDSYAFRARAWAAHAKAQGWESDWFAYIYDEVDGKTDEGADADPQLWHAEMKAVQGALDDGAGAGTIDLIWTSHADAAQWVGTDDDLVGTIRHWAPNAGAANTGFLAQRAAAGERVWFYHEGHPHVGLHTINAAGWEMATWGLIAARYDLSGTFLWAGNLGDPENPYVKPSYKSGDDRFGNGTIVYPGGMLDIAPNVDLSRSPGPLPSIRLKNWRRGLQDAEILKLAGKQGAPLIASHIPEALANVPDGTAARWPSDVEAWHRFRRDLLDIVAPR